MKCFASVACLVLGVAALPAQAQTALPSFVKPDTCLAVTANHISNQRGTSQDARSIRWDDPVSSSKTERASRNELRLCFFMRGGQIAVRAWSWLGNRWRGPNESGLRAVLAGRDLNGQKLERGCLAIRRELPGGFGRIKHWFVSDGICDFSEQFTIFHERVIDEGDSREGEPVKVLRKIFSASIEYSDTPSQ